MTDDSTDWLTDSTDSDSADSGSADSLTSDILSRRTGGQQRAAFIKFWQALEEDEQQCVVAVTEEVPLCPGFGLWNVVEELWHIHETRFLFCTLNKRWLYLMVACVRVFLNVYGSWSNFMRYWFNHDGGHFLRFGTAGTYFNHSKVGIQVCDYELEGSVESSCQLIDMGRWKVAGLMVTVECVFNTVLALLFIVPALCFIFGKRRTAPGRRNLGRRLPELPEKYPFLFFFVPRLAYKISNLMGLQFTNLSRAESLFMRFEGAMWMQLIFRRKLDRTPAPGTKPRPMVAVDGEGCVLSWRYLFSLIFSACVFMYSFQAFVVRMTMFHFVALHSFKYWTFHEWLEVAGFINALAGAFDIDMIEIHRVLLLKFGGEDSTWQDGEIASVSDYISLLSKRIIGDFLDEGHGRRSFCGSLWDRLRVIAIMSHLNSCDLQRLLLCDKRGELVKGAREKRLELYKKLFSTREATEFADLMAKKPVEMENGSPSLLAAKKRLEEWKREEANVMQRASRPDSSVDIGLLYAEVVSHTNEMKEVVHELQATSRT